MIFVRVCWILQYFIYYAGWLWANRNDQQNVYLLQLENNLQFLGSAYQRMEDTPVGDRELQANPEKINELQANPERNKCTRTTETTVQVDPGCLRAASITWSTETWVRQNWAEITARQSYLRSQQPRASLSNLNRSNPSQALGRELALVIRHQSSWMCINKPHPEGNGVVACVWIYLPFRSCGPVWARTSFLVNFTAETVLGSSGIRSPLTPPRTMYRCGRTIGHLMVGDLLWPEFNFFCLRF